MSRMRIARAVLTVAFVAALGSGSALAATPVLKSTVGPGFTITLKPTTGLKAGTYKIVVADKSNIHNFHLKGPGVNKTTSVSATGTTKWTVKLKPGKYTYVCDPHAIFMKGSFTVK
jgi:plastocyanin